MQSKAKFERMRDKNLDKLTDQERFELRLRSMAAGDTDTAQAAAGIGKLYEVKKEKDHWIIADLQNICGVIGMAIGAQKTAAQAIGGIYEKFNHDPAALEGLENAEDIKSYLPDNILCYAQNTANDLRNFAFYSGAEAAADYYAKGEDNKPEVELSAEKDNLLDTFQPLRLLSGYCIHQLEIARVTAQAVYEAGLDFMEEKGTADPETALKAITKGSGLSPQASINEIETILEGARKYHLELYGEPEINEEQPEELRADRYQCFMEMFETIAEDYDLTI